MSALHTFRLVQGKVKLAIDYVLTGYRVQKKKNTIWRQRSAYFHFLVEHTSLTEIQGILEKKKILRIALAI